MRMHWLRASALLAVVALAGCGSREAAEPVADESGARLPEAVDVSLADWLDQPVAVVSVYGTPAAGFWLASVILTTSSDRKSPEPGMSKAAGALAGPLWLWLAA